MKDFKEKHKVKIGLETTGNEGIKNLNEITILKSENIFRDLRLFVETLDSKFKFKNQNEFIKDFIKLIHFDFANKSTKELETIEEKFFEIIKKNSSEADLETNFKKAGDELDRFVNGIKKWPKK